MGAAPAQSRRRGLVAIPAAHSGAGATAVATRLDAVAGADIDPAGRAVALQPAAGAGADAPRQRTAPAGGSSASQFPVSVATRGGTDAAPRGSTVCAAPPRRRTAGRRRAGLFRSAVDRARSAPSAANPATPQPASAIAQVLHKLLGAPALLPANVDEYRGMDADSGQDPHPVEQRSATARQLHLAQAIGAKREEKSQRCSQAGVVAPKDEGVRHMDNGIDDHQVHGDQREAGMDGGGEIQRQADDAPDARNIGDEHRCRRENILAFADGCVKEDPETVVVMLFVLMKHVDGQEQECSGERG